MLKRFWNDEEGMGVVEILLIIAVLIIIALLFRNTIINWVKNILDTLFPDADTVTKKPTIESGT